MYFAKTQGRALKELSPEEVTTNVYMMVDVLLHSIHLQLQHGHSLQVWMTFAYACFVEGRDLCNA
jgi:mediator of RNA polymerase II transcription subunit 23